MSDLHECPRCHGLTDAQGELCRGERHSGAPRCAEEQQLKRHRRVVLVGCGKDKLASPAPASRLYTGPLFAAARGFVEAQQQSFDRAYVLSAKHGLIPWDREVEPYDQRLPQSGLDLHCWGRNIERSLVMDLFELGFWTAEVVVLAGRDYIDPWRGLVPMREFITISEPLSGLGIGERVGWLKRQARAEAA